MRGFNRAIIAGNLTRDPEVRYTVNKRAYARFTVAVNYSYKDANGEYKDAADYINVVSWGSNAEVAGKYLKKGSPVLIEGRIRTGSYDAKDGTGKRYTTEILVDTLLMLGSRENNSDSGGNFAQSSPSGASSPFDMPPGDADFGSSIGDSGFGGGGSFTQGFANDNDSTESTSIPF